MSPDKFTRIVTLIQKKIENELTYNEQLEFEEWINENPENPITLDELTEDFIKEGIRFWDSIDKYRALEIFRNRTKTLIIKKKTSLWKSFAVAASLTLVASVCTYWFLFNKGNQHEISKPVSKVVDILPKQGNVTLILSDGRSIALDRNIRKGQITREEKSIVSIEEGGIRYSSESNFATLVPGKTSTNKVSTGNGKSYMVTLSDGTKVWLNSESSLLFPVAFEKTERIIELTGEAYFEVAKNTQSPFKVKVNGSEIKVLGTNFNVNSYSTSRSINTTLFSGSVLVTSSKLNRLLKPGQQSVVDKDGVISVSQALPIDDVLAWRNGRYSFDQVSIEEIMQELERNYPITEVIYKGRIETKFSGVIRKDLPLSDALKFISQTDLVHFEIVEGNKIIVKP